MKPMSLFVVPLLLSAGGTPAPASPEHEETLRKVMHGIQPI